MERLEFIKNKKECGKYRTLYEIKDRNKNNERLIVEITKVYTNTDNDACLPKLWIKHGYTKHLYTSYLCADCYCYDLDGICKEKYNPTIKDSDDKKRRVINFDYLLDVTEENEEKLLQLIYNNFMKAGL